ncbi:hypothetical protein JCM11641_008118 [Rhodosporidiobolus odoratus]
MSPPPAPPCTLNFTIQHKGAVHTAVYNSGASYVLTGGADRTIKLTNAKSGSQVKVYGGHGYEILGIACTPDNTRFASCGGDRSVFLWDVTSGDIVRRLAGHMGKINTVAWNAAATVLASGSFDTTVRLWDIKSQNRTPLQVLEEARDSITSIRIHEHTIMTGCVDGYVRTYDLRMGQLKVDFFDQPVTALTPLSDNSLLLVATLDSTHRLLDPQLGTVVQSFSGHKNTSYRSQSCVGAKEESVICGDEEGMIWGWELETANPLGKPFKAHEKAVLWTAHHPKEQQLITASSDGTVKVWGKLVYTSFAMHFLSTLSSLLLFSITLVPAFAAPEDYDLNERDLLDFASWLRKRDSLPHTVRAVEDLESAAFAGLYRRALSDALIEASEELEKRSFLFDDDEDELLEKRSPHFGKLGKGAGAGGGAKGKIADRIAAIKQAIQDKKAAAAAAAGGAAGTGAGAAGGAAAAGGGAAQASGAAADQVAAASASQAADTAASNTIAADVAAASSTVVPDAAEGGTLGTGQAQNVNADGTPATGDTAAAVKARDLHRSARGSEGWYFIPSLLPAVGLQFFLHNCAHRILIIGLCALGIVTFTDDDVRSGRLDILARFGKDWRSRNFVST